MRKMLIWNSCILLCTLLFSMVQKGYGQRVYADKQQKYNTLFASVTNETRSIDLPDTTNFSTLNVTLGLLSLIYAQQNLQFVDNLKPSKYSPIIAKIGSNSSLLTLLGGFAIQRTNGGIDNTILPSYSNTQLLNLLNLFGGSQIGTIVFPPNGNDFDGVRFEVNSLLNAALTAYYYYAFYITPPAVSATNISLCDGTTGTVTISNFQSGYTYRLYTAQTGGTQVGSDITTNTINIPSDLAGATYYLEAREGNLYPSARIPFTITRVSRPAAPVVPPISVCTGVASTVSISGPIGGISYRWYTDNNPLSTAIAEGINFSIANPTATTTYYVDAINSNGCVSTTRTAVTVTVNAKPPAPNIALHPNSQY